MTAPATKPLPRNVPARRLTPEEEQAALTARKAQWADTKSRIQTGRMVRTIVCLFHLQASEDAKKAGDEKKGRSLFIDGMRGQFQKRADGTYIHVSCSLEPKS